MVSIVLRSFQRIIMPFGSNNQGKQNIIFERIDDASVLSNFYCGVQEMDDFIHEKLQHYLERTGCNAFVVKHDEQIIAMLALGEDVLILDEDDRDDMILGFVPKPEKAFVQSDFLSEKEFPAIEITYLAVDKKWRNQGIGEYIISQIENKVMIDHPDYEFITVEAYKTANYSAVGFYSRCNFTPAEPPLGYKDTLRMYKVLHPLQHGNPISDDSGNK